MLVRLLDAQCGSFVLGYMHGFFIEMKLYNKLRAVSKPFEYEEYRLKKIKDKIEEKRQSRITAQKRLPKVNKELAEKLLKQSQKSSKQNADSSAAQDAASLVDSRFADLFKREEFQVDEDTVEYKLANPTRSTTASKYDDEDDLRDIYTRVGAADDHEMDEDDDSGESIGDDSDQNDMSGEDEDEELVDRHITKSTKHSTKRRSQENDSDDDGQIAKASRISDLAARIKAKHGRKTSANDSFSKPKKAGPQLYELADGVGDKDSSSKFGVSRDSNAIKTKKLAARIANEIPMTARVSRDGNSFRRSTSSGYVKTKSDGLMKEISFIPKSGGRSAYKRPSKK